VIGKELFIDEGVRISQDRLYKIESNARTGKAHVDFGNKKLQLNIQDGFTHE